MSYIPFTNDVSTNIALSAAFDSGQTEGEAVQRPVSPPVVTVAQGASGVTIIVYPPAPPVEDYRDPNAFFYFLIAMALIFATVAVPMFWVWGSKVRRIVCSVSLGVWVICGLLIYHFSTA